MNMELKSGKYIVAVSGGVDSVVLLAMLRELSDVELVVAHFDHGMRPDSAEDRQFVENLAQTYELPFVYQKGQLGAGASEARARSARYDFLEKARREHDAQTLVTAHHQDDVLETAIINLLRGTGRKGLSALSDRPGLRRPLLKVPKSQLISYAQQHGLEWREDSTNSDQTYLRNYVRHRLLPRFSEQDRRAFLDLIVKSRDNNDQLDAFLAGQIREQPSEDGLDRQWFGQLPHQVALEVMATWLRKNEVRSFDRKTLERLVIAAKTASAGQQFDVLRGVTMKAEKDRLALALAER